jgi:hypothetical protein
LGSGRERQRAISKGASATWKTGAGFHLDVAPGCAIDAFYHPYVHGSFRVV